MPFSVGVHATSEIAESPIRIGGLVPELAIRAFAPCSNPPERTKTPCKFAAIRSDRPQVVSRPIRLTGNLIPGHSRPPLGDTIRLSRSTSRQLLTAIVHAPKITERTLSHGTQKPPFSGSSAHG